MASWSKRCAAHGCSQVALGKPDKAVAAGFVMVEPRVGSQVHFEGIKCPCGGGSPQALRVGYALSGPEQLGQFPFGQGLAA